MAFAFKTNKRLERLDSFRAVLAFSVCFLHLAIWSTYALGADGFPRLLTELNQFTIDWFMPQYETHPAVLAFIALSGYCIHRSSHHLISSNMPAYAIRRAWRILPVYWVALLIGLLGFTITQNVGPTLVNGLSGTAALKLDLIAAKFFGVSAFVPPLHYLTFQGNAPLHTVMVEIWLYAAYPLLMMLSNKRRLLLIAAIWLVGILAITLAPSFEGWWHNGSFFGFLPYWWLGAAVASKRFPRIPKSSVAVLSAVWLALSAALYWSVLDWFAVVELRKLIFATLICITIRHLATPRENGFLVQTTANFGLASYSLYACHAPIMYTALALKLNWISASCLTIVTAALLYCAIERPFTKAGRRLGQV